MPSRVWRLVRALAQPNLPASRMAMRCAWGMTASPGFSPIMLAASLAVFPPGNRWLLVLLSSRHLPFLFRDAPSIVTDARPTSQRLAGMIRASAFVRYRSEKRWWLAGSRVIICVHAGRSVKLPPGHCRRQRAEYPQRDR